MTTDSLPPLSALDYSRLAMATLTVRDFEVHADGALYSPTMLRLFEQAMTQPICKERE